MRTNLVTLNNVNPRTMFYILRSYTVQQVFEISGGLAIPMDFSLREVS